MVAVRARPPTGRELFQRRFRTRRHVGVLRGRSSGFPGTRARGRAKTCLALREREEDPPRGIARPSSSVASRTTESESESESVEKETEKEPRSSSERRSASSRSASAPPPAAPQPPSASSGRATGSPGEARARVKYAVVGAPPRSRRGAGKTPAARREDPTIAPVYEADDLVRRETSPSANRRTRKVADHFPVSRFVHELVHELQLRSIERLGRGGGEYTASLELRNRRTIWRLEGFAPGARLAPQPLAQKNIVAVRSIPKSSRRCEPNPSPFFFSTRRNSNLRTRRSAPSSSPRARPRTRRASRKTPPRPRARRARRAAELAPNRNEGRAFLAADVPSARLARLASFASFAAAAAAASRPYPRHSSGTLSLSDASTGTPYARG